ncbi:response regulator [Desulfuromonas acetoxidans]|uniref:Two component transcriptional regulator, winged helix family n=1 Tax=Desulfuromonas acetoxidans (strain DSM 684 / 11070) TaxID=281689 RepID=Q1K3Q1_DESA6|nr:response regulator [Desulfuromonas acetoxidans]EAT16923.1 two component transcriptional regulator, winged helix family [Desulfuromonas acetoxidans DSM 684]MBF0644548.1 response regulator transcription factor [Desulfuromonas acetoxidans]NVD23925.1 response regulator transcription factor [Desulfuromonas acetoxidans]NVE16222.1 response regulator transcription factor [Desulfuromonas acetoxidans]
MKILVVEDEKKVASFIKRGLEEENFTVDIAANGEEGLYMAESNHYDLILMDIMLPKKDGLTVIKELRSKEVTTPVLCLTAKDSVEDIVAGLDSGSDDYLTKPFAFAELLARVKALVRRGAKDRGAEIYFADLRLDPVTHKVWRADKEIDLTAKEYGLLEYFMRNPNQVLTRTMIAEHVWDYTFDSFTNIIDVYVNYLRKKIDKDYSKKLIHTIRGVGYVLKED